MFKKRFNNFFGDFDSMFNDLNLIFESSPFNVPVYGDVKTETGSDENGTWKKETFTSDDGTYIKTIMIRSKNGNKSLQKETTKLESLKNDLKLAVEDQEFENAAQIRDQIKTLEKNQGKIDQLRKDLSRLVEDQDFESAIKIRDEIKQLES